MDESYYYYLLTQLYLVVWIIAVVSIVINVLIGFGCKKMAENKGYKKTGVFIFLGIFTGIIGLIFTALIEPVSEEEEYKDRAKGSWHNDNYQGSYGWDNYDPSRKKDSGVSSKSDNSPKENEGDYQKENNNDKSNLSYDERINKPYRADDDDIF